MGFGLFDVRERSCGYHSCVLTVFRIRYAVNVVDALLHAKRCRTEKSGGWDGLMRRAVEVSDRTLMQRLRLTLSTESHCRSFTFYVF